MAIVAKNSRQLPGFLDGRMQTGVKILRPTHWVPFQEAVYGVMSTVSLFWSPVIIGSTTRSESAMGEASCVPSDRQFKQMIIRNEGLELSLSPVSKPCPPYRDSMVEEGEPFQWGTQETDSLKSLKELCQARSRSVQKVFRGK